LLLQHLKQIKRKRLVVLAHVLHVKLKKTVISQQLMLSQQ
jgi:hypothetical protein